MQNTIYCVMAYFIVITRFKKNLNLTIFVHFLIIRVVKLEIKIEMTYILERKYIKIYKFKFI